MADYAIVPRKLTKAMRDAFHIAYERDVLKFQKAWEAAIDAYEDTEKDRDMKYDHEAARKWAEKFKDWLPNSLEADAARCYLERDEQYHDALRFLESKALLPAFNAFLKADK